MKVFPPKTPPSAEPDEFTRDGIRKLYDQTITHRDEFKSFAKDVCQTWVGFIIVITVSQMILPQWGFGLSDAAFITVVTTTTASVLGFGFVWGSGIYPNSRRK